MQKTMESFYLSILNYGSLKYEDGIISCYDVLKNESSKYTIDGKDITLPYMDNLKNPNGRSVFHLLNENYANPETPMFSQYMARLTYSVNLRLASLVMSLITVAADVKLQQKVRSTELLNIISGLPEMDMTMLENFLAAVTASKKTNDVGYIVSFYLRRNGDIGGVPYSATGKVNFVMPNEVTNSLEAKGSDYRIFGAKVRKKDLMALNDIFNALFPGMREKDIYIEGTDNKIFRYLSVLLKITYMITARMNQIADLLDELNEPSLHIDGIRSDLNWLADMETLCGMATDIRLIPNQDDISISVPRSTVNEAKAETQQQVVQPQNQVTTYVPPSPQPVQQQPVQQQQPGVQQPLTPEEIIAMQMGRGPGMMQQQPMMMQPPGMMMPGMMQPPMMMQPQIPMWARQQQQQQQYNNGMQPMQPGMMPMMPNMPGMPMITGQPGMMGHPMMMPQQPVMMQQPGMMMQPGMQMINGQPGMMAQPGMQMPQQSGLQLNPHFQTQFR